MAVSLRELDCFVFDMDGTINLGDTLIPGAKELIALLRAQGRKFFFFTNNSSRSPEAYVQKLTRLGFPGMSRQHILTSGDVMIHYLKTHFGPAPYVYLAGTPELETQFRDAGIYLCSTQEALPPQAVVLGFDTTFDFAKAETLCRYISAGAPFLATNIDRVCPLEGGAYLPDCGSIARMIAQATGVEPKFTGKPFRETVDFILNAAGTPPEKTAIVGDRLYTDIATAAAGGIVGIAVLSGEVTRAEIDAQQDIRPDYILDSVADIAAALQEDAHAD